VGRVTIVVAQGWLRSWT